MIVNHFDRLEGSAPERLIAAATHLTGCPVDVQWTDGQPRYRSTATVPPTRWMRLSSTGCAGHCARRPLHLADPALVEVVISAKEQPADRGRAIRLLGFGRARDLVVLAVSLTCHGRPCDWWNRFCRAVTECDHRPPSRCCVRASPDQS